MTAMLRPASVVLHVLAVGVAFASGASTGPVDVFVSGEGGYHTYRIPAIVRAPDGGLLAFCEGRRHGRGDAGDIDLLLKRSDDGGRTWSAATVLWDDDANTCGNPCPVVDYTTGTIWLFATHNLGADHEREIKARTSAGTRTVWLLRSDKHGETWSAPVEITATTKDPSWGWYATGPGIGIQIKHGPHAGRLVVPCDHSHLPNDDLNEDGRGSHVVFSDDHGRTWQLGGTIRPQMNECQVAELFDDRGTLLVDMRSYRGRSLRAQSRSSDGGATWTEPVDARGLVEPVCQASLLRHDAARLLLFSNPAHPKRRVNLTVRASDDDGATWSNGLLLHEGPAAYSCLVALDAGDAACLFECGFEGPYEKVVFVRFAVDDALK